MPPWTGYRVTTSSNYALRNQDLSISASMRTRRLRSRQDPPNGESWRPKALPARFAALTGTVEAAAAAVVASFCGFASLTVRRRPPNSR